MKNPNNDWGLKNCVEFEQLKVIVDVFGNSVFLYIFLVDKLICFLLFVCKYFLLENIEEMIHML